MKETKSSLREARLAKNVSLSEMAKRMGVSKGHLSGIENGHKPVTEKVVRQYEIILEATLPAPKETVPFYDLQTRKDMLAAITVYRERLEVKLDGVLTAEEAVAAERRALELRISNLLIVEDSLL